MRKLLQLDEPFVWDEWSGIILLKMQ